MAASSKQTRAKQERVIEVVRRGLEGPAAIEFIRNSGYAMTQAGIARHLRTMGGRGRISELIQGGNSNLDILQSCFPGEEIPHDIAMSAAPSQEELFGGMESSSSDGGFNPDQPLYDTVKLTVTLPADLHEALKLAAKAEHKKQNDLIVEILTSHLARTPDLRLFAEGGE